MIVEHTLEITAICPVDKKPDVYRCTVRASRTIPVEKILDAVKVLAAQILFQEDLTRELHRALSAEIETVGWHSGVRTRVNVGGASS